MLSEAGIEFEVEFQLDGWRVNPVSANQSKFIHFDNQKQDLPIGATLVLALFRPEEPIDELAEWFRSHDFVDQATEPERTTVGGAEALQFDLLPVIYDEDDPSDACWGLILDVSNSVWQEGINGCTWVRLWVVSVDAFAVSTYGQAVWETLDGEGLDPDNVWQIEDFQPLLDDFINGLTFCTTATPCDG